MFEVVAYPEGAEPFVTIQTNDKVQAERFYRTVAEAFDRQGLPTTVGLDRRDPTAPQGWRELQSNRPGLTRPVFPRD